MDTELLWKRLRDVGLDNTVVASEATLRPLGDDTVSDATGRLLEESSSSNTLLAHIDTSQQSFPRLSVDLRIFEGAPSPTTSDLEVRGIIGEGGMGRVLLARQHSLRRDVAVKTAKLGASEQARRAILEEGAITGHLEHPAIVPVHALGLDASGSPAMVMKRVEGVGWHDLLADAAHPGWEGWDGAPDDRLAGHLQIMMSVCNALHFAHSRGIVHRDIKPENVLIGSFGDVYLADWGVAGRIGEEQATICGTPGFMAPEMAMGARIDARTDVYLLGATLHEVLTGARRHQGATVAEVVAEAARSPAFDYPSHVPAELAALANAACHVDADQRPSSAQSVRDTLREFLRHQDSRALSREAAQRVTRVRELCVQRTLDEDERSELDQVVAEARFGLEQALVQWRDNRPAKEALASLEELLHARRARALELEREQWERNPHVSFKGRAVMMTTLGVGSGVIALLGAFRTRPPTPIELVAFPSGVLAVFTVGLLLMRKRIEWNSFNQQALFTALAALGLMILGRAMGFFFDISVAEHMIRDAFTFTATFTMVGITLMRWALWVALISFLAAVGCMFMRDRAMTIFSTAATLIVALITWFAWTSPDLVPRSRL